MREGNEATMPRVGCVGIAGLLWMRAGRDWMMMMRGATVVAEGIGHETRVAN